MAARRAFRIEQSMSAGGDPANDVDMAIVPTDTKSDQSSNINTDAILKAIAEIKDSLSSTSDLDLLREDMAKAASMNDELQTMQDAIASTKQEIAALHGGGLPDKDLGRVSHELDAVIGGTEEATDNILTAAEVIDELASNLNAGLEGQQAAMAHDIQDKIVEIFEACNFQDLTGQRITKVVRTLQFIETRVSSMMDIWGGMESFKDVTPSDSLKGEGDDALLNGPSLATDDDISDQGDIDALFD